MLKEIITGFVLLVCTSSVVGEISEVCRDLVEGVQKQHDVEDINQCYECDWYMVDTDTRTSKSLADSGKSGSMGRAWCSDGKDDYLQIEVGSPVKLGGFEISGDPSSNSWVTLLRVSYKDDSTGVYKFTKDTEGRVENYIANDESVRMEEVKFRVPVETSSVRIHPMQNHNSACMRVDLFSCGRGDAEESTGMMSRMAHPRRMPRPECKRSCSYICPKYKLDWRGCETCECEKLKLGEKYEADILVTPQTMAGLNNVFGLNSAPDGVMKAASRGVAKWTDYKNGNNYDVPYIIASSFSSRHRGIIKRAIDDLARVTCINLVPRRSQPYYIRFFRGQGCFSPVGKQRGGNSVSIGYGCEYPGTVVHEILHSVGFWHEQSRPDRDQYVSILTQNIQNGVAYNFQKHSKSQINSLGSPYDTGSIMHYNSHAFSKNGRPTIVDKNNRPIRTQRERLSAEDINQINRMYQCSGTKTTTTARTSTVKTTTVGGSCADSHRHCNYWAGIGECKKNSEYMWVYCKKSCRKCTTGPTTTEAPRCSDKNRNCPGWKVYCTYSRYRDYMTKNCPFTCRRC